MYSRGECWVRTRTEGWIESRVESWVGSRSESWIRTRIERWVGSRSEGWIESWKGGWRWRLQNPDRDFHVTRMFISRSSFVVSQRTSHIHVKHIVSISSEDWGDSEM